MISLRKLSQFLTMFIFGAVAGVSWAQSPAASEPRLIIKGYDPVAYFTDNKAVKGTPAVSFEWDEGRYQFASDTNKKTFASNPDQYAPQFAGFCTGGVSKGMKAEANPELFIVANGKLFMFSSAKARDAALADPELFNRAAKNWQSKKNNG